MFKDSRIYVAGHAGLLGSALVEELKAGGYSEPIIRSRDALDLADRGAVFEFFEAQRPEYVFIAAGKVGGIVSNRAHGAEYLHANLAIQDNLFEACVRYEATNVVFYGSSCTYPRQCPQPMREDHLFTGALEETSLGYAAAKIAGLAGCRVYNRQYGAGRFIALIPNSMYGPNDDFDFENCHVLSALVRRFHEARMSGADSVTLWGTGKPRREFIYSRDVAAASLFAVEHADQLENRHYNVGTGVDYSIEELASMIAEITGYQGRICWDTDKPDGAPRKLLDSESFRGLGWRPQTELKDGLIRTYRWYCEHQPVSQR